MFSLLLRKALPFALTFVIGTALSGLAGLFRGAQKTYEAPLVTRTYDFHGRCRMRSRNLVAETKPLVILFKPDARWPREVDETLRHDFAPTRVVVTFGADGKVQNVQPPADLLCCKSDWPQVRVYEAAASAARNIQFEPETINSVPISVEKEIEIHFIGDDRW